MAQKPARPPKTLRRLLARGLDFAFESAPSLASIVAFVIGALALIDVATPNVPRIPGFHALELVIGEWPELAASIAGVALMALAFGLRRRLDSALIAAIALLGFFALYAFIRREHVPAGIICTLGIVYLVTVRHAFYRKAGLAALAPAPPLYLAIVAVLVIAAIGGVLWASERPGFADAPWWKLFTGRHIGRPGRVISAGLIVLGIIAWWHALIAPSRRSPLAPSLGERTQALALLQSAEEARPDIQLALLDDKSFIFGEDKRAFMMAARAGTSLVAMGGPIGAHAAWRGTLSAFRTYAERGSLRPVIYAVPPNLLPELIEIGFRMEKIGENAVVDLHAFNLVGKDRQDLRTARRRIAEREGALLQILYPPINPQTIESLEPVSQAWLAKQSGGEKSFTLGRFDAAYLANFPLAVVRMGGAPVAFANILTTPDKRYASIDLMRYDPARSPPGMMDFLICEIILWAQREGYQKFDLGMAPLSGLATERHAPLFQKLGRLLYEEGSAFYNFEGLRHFKEKFGPDWEPRYLAAPGSWSMPIVLAEIALLTSGGTRGLLQRPPKTEASGT